MLRRKKYNISQQRADWQWSYQEVSQWMSTQTRPMVQRWKSKYQREKEGSRIFCVHRPNQLVWHAQCGSLILSSPCLPPLANQIWLPPGLVAPAFQLILQNISIEVLQNNYVLHFLAEHLQMTVREEMQDHSSLCPPVGFYSWGDWQNTWHLDSVCSDSGTDFIRNSKMLTCQSALFCLCNQFKP